MRELIEAIARLRARVVGLEQSRTRPAQVISTSPLEVRFFGDSQDTEVSTMAHYTPTTGDKVAVMKVGTGWWVVGDIS